MVSSASLTSTGSGFLFSLFAVATAFLAASMRFSLARRSYNINININESNSSNMSNNSNNNELKVAQKLDNSMISCVVELSYQAVNYLVHAFYYSCQDGWSCKHNCNTPGIMATLSV